MRKTTRSILQELNDVSLSRDPALVIESRGTNIIQSAINLIELIRENFDADMSLDIERRFLNSIRTGDIAKFSRGVRRSQQS